MFPGRLNVRRVRPVYDRPEYHKWVVGETSEESNVLDVDPGDLLFVGAAPGETGDYLRAPKR